MMGGAQPAAAQEKQEAPAEDLTPVKNHFTVQLVSFADNAKIKVLKEIRTLIPGLQLTESKALIENLPSKLKEGLPKDEAEKWEKKLTEVGAVIKLI